MRVKSKQEFRSLHSVVISFSKGLRATVDVLAQSNENAIEQAYMEHMKLQPDLEKYRAYSRMKYVMEKAINQSVN